MEGIVVGMVGNGIADNGGNATFGIVGMVGMVGIGGNEGLGKVGNWVLGNGGSVGNGKVGMVGREGNEVVGIGGNMGLGRVGIVGSDSAGGGATGSEVSKRWRAARLTSMHRAMTKDKMKQCIEAAMGLVVEGGGEKKGMEVGVEGMVICMVGNGIADNGGNATFGIVGMVGTGQWRQCRLRQSWQSGTRHWWQHRHWQSRDGVDGGGEKKGIEVGMKGIEVGMVGNGNADNGGNATFGRVGMVGMVGSGGNAGLGKVGNWVLGNGGSVGIGKVGTLGREGNEVVGIGGSMGLGRVGIVGSVSAGGGATGSKVSKRWRAARLTSMHSTMTKDKMKQCIEPWV
ncbi:hypothetical protein HHK36_004354 [Tetracentron sinense]|uniref:Uncharacterized protein n=1 Tax=Tetracentron sinense TaxID=13715 RepID=A0A834ZUA2_TETSI|nr:hypothetical protein HHK36_004354 [Tetracentron sinense]